MAASVQFYGKDSVMSAAKNLGCTHWAVFISRQLFMKCESLDLDESLDKLDQCLDMLSESGTQGIYCIKFFETEKPGQIMKINEKSVVTGGSFNFKMIDIEQHNAGVGNVLGYSSQIMELKKQVAELKKELLETEPDEPETIGSILMGALKDPQQADHLMQLFQMGRMLLGFAPLQQPAAIGAAQPQSHAATPMSESDEEKIKERFANAVDILGAADPLFIEHLEKLAVMAQKEPGKFKMLISML